MSVIETPTRLATSFLVVLRIALSGDDSDVDTAVGSIDHRIRWMRSVGERFGDVQMSHDQAADSTTVIITAAPPARPNVRSASAARLMIESALMNELRSTGTVRIDHVHTTSQELS